jgi:hypothetical protein
MIIENMDTPNSYKRYVFSAVAIAAIALFMFWAYLQYVASVAIKQSNASLGAITSTTDQLLMGNLDSAQSLARSVQETNADARVQVQARGLEATALYLSGDTEERLKAIALLKQNYLDASGTPQSKASIINSLLGYISNSREQAIFESIFTGAPFDIFRVEGDYTGSIRKLANQSLGLYPTSYAIFQASLHDLAPLVNYDKTYTINDAEKRKHAEAIIADIKRADALFAQERSRTGLAVREPATYYYWKGLLWGAVATVQPEHLADSKEAYGQLVAYYETTRDKNGATIPYIRILVPYAYSGYANALARVDAEKYKKEIVKQLDLYMAEVKGNEKVHESGVIAHIKNVAKSTTATQTYTISNYKRLAAIYPAYKQFLAGYGLELK